MPAPKAPTPLSLEEASRIIARLGDLAGDGNIVVIGGSALSLWHAKLLSQPPSPQLATGDIDLQGNADAVQIAAELLEGTHRLSRFDEHTTQTGAVAFNDSTGEQRVLDFLSHPYGLDAERVSERAIPLDIDAGGPAPVRISVMHPLDCLRSRVANSDLPGRATDHAEAQLRAAVALVPAYCQLLLDQDAHPREVMSINEQVYDLALRDHRAKRLYLEMGIDVSTAVLDDPRLPDEHRHVRLPQLRATLAADRGQLPDTR